MSDRLHVTTDIPAGNAVVLDLCEAGGVPEIHFTPSPAGGPEAMWFCFEAAPRGTLSSAAIRCVLHSADTLLGGGGAKGFFPVYKTGRRDWQRVEAVDTAHTADGRPLLSWLVPGGEGAVRVALCYPYGEAERDALIGELAPAFRCDTIGVTSENRRLLRLANGCGEEGSARPGVYCLARQHAGETPGSWVLDGFLRGMAAAGSAAPLTWAVPFADADGVVAGCYGKDRFPWDFNRAWGSWGFPRERYDELGSQPMRYEVRCMQADMARWTRRCRPLIALDFHAPGMCEDQGIYCFLRDLEADGKPTAADQIWVDAFRQALGEGVAADPFFRSGRYHSRWNTARVGDYVTEVLKLREFSFEAPYGRSAGAILTRDAYQQAGRRLAAAVCALCACA